MINKRLSLMAKLKNIVDRLSNGNFPNKQSISTDLYVVLFELHDNLSILQDLKLVEKKLASFSQDTLPSESLIYSIQALAVSIAKAEGVFNKSDVTRATLVDNISKMSDEQVLKLVTYSNTLLNS